MTEQWILMTKRADFQKIGEQFHIDPVTARIIRNRGIQGDEAIREYLTGSIHQFPNPRMMKDMTKALDLIQQGIRQKRKIRIIGDYDIDGVMSTYILKDGLEKLGAKVDTYIPHRIYDGYGIHDDLVRQAKEDKVELIITCDNGISACSEIALAKDLGMDVIVTDHHSIPYEEKEGKHQWILPPADAIINPKQEDCPYPFKELCGAAVAYKVVEAIYERYGKTQEEYNRYLELVAIATVGDVMNLQGENRILVKEGLHRLKNPSNLGICQLLHGANLQPETLTAYHIGFVLGPCMNASGRLDTAVHSLKLLESTNEQEAARLAGDLCAMNETRKALTQEGIQEAVDMVESSSLKNDSVLVVFLPHCHESLAGIIAGRLREKYYRPALVLTRGEDMVKGSGRSIEEYSMCDELNRCQDLLEKFGGHPMAAGLSLKEENVSAFRQRLNEQCTLTQNDLTPKIMLDAAMPLSYVSESLVEEFACLEPFGKGNQRPLFAQRKIRVLEPRVFGKNKNVVQLKIDDGINIYSGVYFGDGETFTTYVTKQEFIDITYYPETHSWRGETSLRIIIKNYR